MRMRNYLVSVFVNNKCVDLFFSEDLCELHVCRMLHKGCEIQVHDMRNYSTVPRTEVRKREAERLALTRGKSIPDQVVCVETKQVFASLDVCALETGIPRFEIMDSITRLTTIGGRHYLFSSDLFNEKDLLR